MAGFVIKSVLCKVALGLCVAAVVFHVVGFPTPSWTDAGGSSRGLFEKCLQGSCNVTEESKKSDVEKVIAAVVTIGLVIGLVCLAFILNVIFVELMATRAVKIVCVILSFLAAVLVMTGVILYGVKYDANLGWSFFIEIISGLLFISTSLVLLISAIKDK